MAVSKKQCANLECPRENPLPMDQFRRKPDGQLKSGRCIPCENSHHNEYMKARRRRNPEIREAEQAYGRNYMRKKRAGLIPA